MAKAADGIGPDGIGPDWIGVDWIGVDWQEARVCAHVIGPDGAVLETRTAPGGGTAAPALIVDLLKDLLPHAGSLPVIACGLPTFGAPGGAGAALRPLPCPPLPAALHRVTGTDPRLALYAIPGLRQDRPVDELRGPETRIAGFLAGAPDFDGVLCLPGPISTWARISAGEVVTFTTTLTGEMFDLLAHRSSLRHGLPPDGHDGGQDPDAFKSALADILSRPERLAMMISALRGVGTHKRARLSRLSGLLIGAELAATRPWWLGQSVAVIGGGDLAQRYADALAAQGVQATISGANMTLAGLARARALLRGA